MTTGTDDKEQEVFEASQDFANYFCTYEFLYHQKQMLEDQRRMSSYHSAVMNNKELFKDKVVLDVGAGSGILSIWAAQAGAKKVYGVEATKVAAHAQNLVNHNGLGGVVTIIRSSIENAKIPEKVDIIISEWMGYFLLRESMLDSVIIARDKFLKPGGLLFPSEAKMFIAPIFNEEATRKHMQYQETIQDWTNFFRQTKVKYGVDMECLTPSFRNEQYDFYMSTAAYVDLSMQDLVGKSCRIATFDLNTCTVESIKVITADFSCPLLADTRVSGIVGWFSTDFEGTSETPCAKPFVSLNTAPGMGYTHWGQQCFTVYPPVTGQRGDSFCGTVEITRRKENQRLLTVKFKHSIKDSAGETVNGPVEMTSNIQ